MAGSSAILGYSDRQGPQMARSSGAAGGVACLCERVCEQAMQAMRFLLTVLPSARDSKPELRRAPQDHTVTLISPQQSLPTCVPRDHELLARAPHRQHLPHTAAVVNGRGVSTAFRCMSIDCMIQCRARDACNKTRPATHAWHVTFGSTTPKRAGLAAWKLDHVKTAPLCPPIAPRNGP